MTPSVFFAQTACYAKRFAGEFSAGGFVRRTLEQFAAVWNLITRIPLRGISAAPDFALPSPEALTLMPIAGAFFGLTAAIIPASLLAAGLPSHAAAWLNCGLYAILGWGLHLDGWGDLWDGFGSGRRGEELRKVMKDPRTGVFGVTGVVLALGMRASLIPGNSAAKCLAVCALAAGVGRFGGAVAACMGEYPWESGMARDIVRGFDGYQMFRSLLFTCLLLPLSPFNWTFGMILSAAAALVLSAWSNKRLGGVNGDVIGAASVLGELLTLIACSFGSSF